MIHVKGCGEPEAEHEICRDKTGKPRVVLLDGKTVRSYARASSFGDALDDKGGLIAWSQANAIRGVLASPEIGQRFAAVDDGWVKDDAKTAMKALIAEAAVVGGAEVKANKGTDLHSWTEALDRGLPLVGVPAEHEADIDAYAWLTSDLEHLVIEEFCVLDEYKVGGTPDRVSRYPDPCPDCGNETYITDLKTGSVGFPGKMAVQLAVYSRAVKYHQSEGQGVRTPLPESCPHRAIIINLPAGAGTGTLYWLDIDAGWRQITGDAPGGIPGIKSWRSGQRNLLTPISA